MPREVETFDSFRGFAGADNRASLGLSAIMAFSLGRGGLSLFGGWACWSRCARGRRRHRRGWPLRVPCLGGKMKMHRVGLIKAAPRQVP